MSAWALLPPNSGPALNNKTRVEVADHVLPAFVIAIVSITILVPDRHLTSRPTLPLVAGLIVLLAGLWMVATHVPLVAQASRGEVTWAATAYHSVPSVAALVLGLAWAGAHWSDAPSS